MKYSLCALDVHIIKRLRIILGYYQCVRHHVDQPSLGLIRLTHSGNKVFFPSHCIQSLLAVRKHSKRCLCESQQLIWVEWDEIVEAVLVSSLPSPRTDWIRPRDRMGWTGPASHSSASPSARFHNSSKTAVYLKRDFSICHMGWWTLKNWKLKTQYNLWYPSGWKVVLFLAFLK